MTYGDLIEPIGFGFQATTCSINEEFMEQKEFHLQLMFLVLGVVQLLGLIPLIPFGYLEDMDLVPLQEVLV